MPFLPWTLSVLLSISSAAPAPPRSFPKDPVLVRAVASGDLIDVAAVGRIRLAAIRAPRLSRWAGQSEPFAAKAQARLASLLVNRWIRLEPLASTRLGRVRSAYVVTEDGQFINALLVREGLARVAAAEITPRGRELSRAEAEARTAGRGLWGAP